MEGSSIALCHPANPPSSLFHTLSPSRPKNKLAAYNNKDRRDRRRLAATALKKFNNTGIANPNLIYTKGDNVASFFTEEFDVEVLLDEGRKAKASSQAWLAKPGNAAKASVSNKAFMAIPGNAAKKKATNKAYWAKNKETLTAIKLASLISAAFDRLNSGDWSESGTTSLAQITTYVQNIPDDRLVYIFMSSEDQRSIETERSKNKEKIVKMGGEETTYVEKDWKIVGLDVVTPREKGTGLNGVPDDAGYVIARTVEALAVEENRGLIGNQRGSGGGGIPHMVLLRSGRVCVGSMKRSEESDSEESDSEESDSEESDSEESAAEGYSSEPLGAKKRKLK